MQHHLESHQSRGCLLHCCLTPSCSCSSSSSPSASSSPSSPPCSSSQSPSWPTSLSSSSPPQPPPHPSPCPLSLICPHRQFGHQPCICLQILLASSCFGWFYLCGSKMPSCVHIRPV